MDKIVENPVNILPVASLHLSLPRTLIRMRHDDSWSVDKTIGCHDLFICMSGKAHYLLNDHAYTIEEGQGIWVPAGTRYRGHHGGNGLYTGVAQHFNLTIFNEIDLFSLIAVKNHVAFSRWKEIKPLVEFYMRISPTEGMSLQQNYLFLTLLLEFVNDAFTGWKGGNSLPWHVVNAATTIDTDILDRDHVDTVLAKVPYSRDYFIRIFRRYMGCTPALFQQLRRLERAKDLLYSGRSVKETAALLGYSDPYYFSRLFKKRIGISPAKVARE